MSNVLAGAFGDDKQAAQGVRSFGPVYYPLSKATKIDPFGAVMARRLSITCVLVPKASQRFGSGRYAESSEMINLNIEGKGPMLH